MRAPKGATKREKKRAEVVDFHARELTKRAEAGDSDALRKLTDVVVAFEQLTTFEHKLKKIRAQWKDKVGAQEARFSNEIEEAHDVGARESDHSKKLRRVEVAWSELTDVKAAKKEAESVVKAEIRKWRKQLNKAMENSAQLTMEKKWAGGDEDEPAEPDTDEEADELEDDGDPLDDAEELEDDAGDDAAEGEGAATF